MSKIENENFNGIYEIRSESNSFSIDSTYEGTIVSANPSGGLITVTLPADFPQGFSFEIMQVGAGSIDFSPAIGATIYNNTVTIGEQYQRVRVINSIFIYNEWLLDGYLI